MFTSQHTPSFPALLQQLGATLLVSTYQSGRIILLRARDGVLNTHFCALDRPMGLAARGGRLAVATGFQVWEYRDLPAVGAKLPEPCDACYLPRRMHVTGDIDSHELVYADDDELWLVNTRMSCLCTLDPAYSVVPRWRPPFVSGYDLTDRCHLNGLALRNGRPAYVTALGETDSPAGWRTNKARGGVLLEVPGGRVIARGLSMPHSPRWQADRLWLLESGAGTLTTIDPAGGRPRVIAELPGFTRGLDFAGRYAFVGLSQVRETAIFAGLPLTERVAERHCGVWVVDLTDGAIVAFVVFTGAVQEIFAVQLLPHRFPILLEATDALLRTSYSLPDEALGQVVAADPLLAVLERANARHQEGRLEEARALYREVLGQDPHHPTARFQLGVALVEAERWSEAEPELVQVIAAQPAHAEAHNSLGLCRAGQERWGEAIEHFDAAIAADRQYATAHVNRALLLLKLGRYAEGWSEYEWRWRLPGRLTFSGPQARWQGEAITDKTLLVFTERNASEAIRFARFLPPAARRCRRLILVCADVLRPLLGGVEGVAETRLDIPPDRFDLYCPLSSLPGVLDCQLDNLPATVPYLRAPDHLGVPRLAADTPRIGLLWADAATHPGNRHHSCPIERLAPLFTASKAGWYSLQTPIAASDAAWLDAHGVINLEPELTDFARAAALIDQLDLVISVDTPLAHLAGALGKPLWMLLGQPSDGCWLLERADSPWYPTARLFRQQRAGDWEDVIERIRAALDGLFGTDG
ncbi:TIGR03032 family protein [Thiocystis violacea]|uniref:TIGR03032 family protein n=1 Tax=Thiocystis violacea TaxID=13725 RepID=UPI00190790AE